MDGTQPTNSAGHDDNPLMRDVLLLNSALGHYVMRVIDAADGRRDEVSSRDEHVLADRARLVADGIKARAIRRGHPSALPVTIRDRQDIRKFRLPMTGDLDDAPRTLDEDAVTQWPFLALLADLPGPTWYVRVTSNGAVACARTHNSYTEAVWVVDECHVGLNRTPFQSGPRRRAVSRLDVYGSFDAVVEALRRPVRWENEP